MLAQEQKEKSKQTSESLLKKLTRDYLPGALLTVAFILLAGVLFATAYRILVQPLTFNITLQQNPGAFGSIDPQWATSLHKIADEAFGRATSALNFDVAILTAIIAAFGVAIGFQYFSKQAELRDSLRRVENAPEEMVSLFYRRQLSGLAHAIFDKDTHRRRITILSLLSNPQITVQHYSTLSLAVKEEFRYQPNIFLEQNLQVLIPILFSLDPDAAVIDLVRLFDDVGTRGLELAPSTMQILAASEAEIAKQKVREILRDRTELAAQMLTALLFSRTIKRPLAAFIAAECPDSIFNTCLAWSANPSTLSAEYISDLVRNKKEWTQQSMSIMLNSPVVSMQEKLHVLDASLNTLNQATLGFLTAALPNILVNFALRSPADRLELQQVMATLANLKPYVASLYPSNQTLASVFIS